MTLVLVATLAACGLPANVVVLVPDEAGTVGQIVVSEGNAQKELSAPYSAIGTTKDSRTSEVFVANRRLVEAVFAGALRATPRAPAVYVIFFILGQTEVDPSSLGTLRAALDAAHSTANADIGIVGHTDAIGNEDQNLALSLKRAQAIRDALVNSGVAPSSIEIGYHGSHNPRIPRPPGVPEPENRRVEITIR
jgi:hypothetical protein